MANDFSKLDFHSLWNGRDKVSEIERTIIKKLLGEKKIENVMEIGCGNGRVLGELKSVSGNCYAVDLERKFLEEAHKLYPEVVTVNADLHYLPFRKHFFDAIIMVRVLNFLDDPYCSIKRISSHLRAGGTLILSYYQYPSLTCILDRVFPNNMSEASVPGKKDFGVKVRRSNFQEFFYRKKDIEKASESAGLNLSKRISTGIADYLPFKLLDLRAIRVFESTLQDFSILPHTFEKFHSVLQEDSYSSEVGPFECQLCGTPFIGVPNPNETMKCGNCGSTLSNIDGIITFNRDQR